MKKQIKKSKSGSQKKLANMASNYDKMKVVFCFGKLDRDGCFALQNKLRLIGIRENEKFHVIWYDPEHEFCPSSK